MSQRSYDQDDRVIICSENISSNHKITTLEILSHAEKLGVDYLTEHELLPIVLNGLIHPLPADWIPCYDRQLQEFFYYNLENGTSQWEHPIDKHYRNLISIIRNEYGGNLSQFLRDKENSNMLPLRQNRKPQLLPIKKLLRYKEEEKSIAADDKIVKYDLHSSLKTKTDSSPAYKKSVSFSTKESASEKDPQFIDTGYEKRADEISPNIDNWIPESIDQLWESGDFRNSKLEISPLSRNLNKKITSLEQSFNDIKSNTETQTSNNFKRLHINLRLPDSLLFSDSNQDDTTKNILSASPSSELVSEEEGSPHNMLTNESGIDVNTVTDLQKLKARSKLSNQNIDIDKQLSCVIDNLLRKAIAEVEKNLAIKLETMITEEIAKLKKLERDVLESNFNKSILNIEKQTNYDTLVGEIRESFKIFQEEIERKVKKNHIALEELQNTYNLEMCKIREHVKQALKFSEKEHECIKNTENCQKILQNLIEERLDNIEQGLVKKIETLKTEHKSEWEEFKLEKEKKLAELDERYATVGKIFDGSVHSFSFGTIKHEWSDYLETLHEKFRTFVEKNSNIIVQQGLNKLFVKMTSDDPIFLNFEKIVFKILNEKRTEISIEHVDKKTIATQTESAFNVEEITIRKENLSEICSAIKDLVDETLFSKRPKSEEIFKEDLDDIFSSKNSKKMNYPIRAEIPLNIESYKTDFISFEDFSLHIDEELDFYRNKYLSRSKWWNIKGNKN